MYGMNKTQGGKSPPRSELLDALRASAVFSATLSLAKVKPFVSSCASRNERRVRQFYPAFPIHGVLCLKLNRAQCRRIMRVENGGVEE
jgi:hypothetical protein